MKFGMREKQWTAFEHDHCWGQLHAKNSSSIFQVCKQTYITNLSRTYLYTILMMMMMKLPILPCTKKLELVLSTAPKTSDNTDKDSKSQKHSPGKARRQFETFANVEGGRSENS